jgi:hypothetical protein
MTLALQLVQVAFYLATGTAAVLTLMQARRTVLQPARNETFKSQLELLRKISELMPVNKTDASRHLFLDEYIAVNATLLIKDYYSHMGTPLKIPAEVMPGHFVFRKVPGATRGFTYIRDRNTPKSSLEHPQPPPRSDDWTDYLHAQIGVPDNAVKYFDSLGVYAREVLLPVSVRTLLDEYMAKAYSLVYGVGEAFCDAGKTMPSRYPTMADLRDASEAWLNHFVSSHAAVAPLLEEIGERGKAVLIEIRTLLHVNTLTVTRRDRSSEDLDKATISMIPADIPTLWRLKPGAEPESEEPSKPS